MKNKDTNTVILSIKPQYVEKIFSGEKRFEYRKKIWKNTKVNRVIIYASAPVKKIVGEFEIDIEKSEWGNLDILWEETQYEGGISIKEFYEYFKGHDYGFAIRIKNPIRYDEPLDIKEHFNLNPPQNFCYLKN